MIYFYKNNSLKIHEDISHQNARDPLQKLDINLIIKIDMT